MPRPVEIARGAVQKAYLLDRTYCIYTHYVSLGGNFFRENVRILLMVYA